MKQVIFGLLFLTGVVILSKAQQIQLINKDSLLQVLKTSKEDTNKALLMILIGNQYEKNQPDSALYYYKYAGDLSKKLNFPKGIFKYYSNTSAVFNIQNKLEESLALNVQSLALAEKMKDINRQAFALNNIGASYYNMRLYDKCIEYFLKAITVFENMGDSANLVTMYANMAGLYATMEQQSEKGYEFGLKALQMSRALKDTFNIEASLNNIGSILMDLKRYDTALIVLKQALVISKNINDLQGETTSLININDIYFKMGNYARLKLIAEQALISAQKINSVEGIINANLFWASTTLKIKILLKPKYLG